MGSLLQIRDVPGDVRRALKERAASQGESLNGYLGLSRARDLLVVCGDLELVRRVGGRPSFVA